MPLPSSGPISFADLNEELGNASNSQLDMDSAAIAFNLTKPHGMDEFYGLSTTTTTTTLAPQSRLAERLDGGATGRVALAQGFGEFDQVLVNDGSGQCWALGALSTLSPQFSITGPCPPPTTTTITTTTIAPTCNSYEVVNESPTSGTTVGYNECGTGNFVTALVGANRTRTFCARTNSLEYVSGSTQFTITDFGTCT